MLQGWLRLRRLNLDDPHPGAIPSNHHQSHHGTRLSHEAGTKATDKGGTKRRNKSVRKGTGGGWWGHRENEWGVGENQMLQIWQGSFIKMTNTVGATESVQCVLQVRQHWSRADHKSTKGT